MSIHVLLNLLNELVKSDNFIFFRNELNKFNNRSTNVRFYLSYAISIIFKSYFWRKNVRVFDKST